MLHLTKSKKIPAAVSISICPGIWSAKNHCQCTHARARCIAFGPVWFNMMERLRWGHHYKYIENEETIVSAVFCFVKMLRAAEYMAAKGDLVSVNFAIAYAMQRSTVSIDVANKQNKQTD
jgi:hypothetical protein